MLPHRSVLIGQKLVENAKIQKFKCDILTIFKCCKKIVFLGRRLESQIKSFRLIKSTSNTCFGNLLKCLEPCNRMLPIFGPCVFSHRSRHAEASAFFKKYLYKCIHEFSSLAHEKIEDKCEEKFLA